MSACPPAFSVSIQPFPTKQGEILCASKTRSPSSQAAAKHIIAQKSGCIVNIASVAGLFPYNWAGAYCVVKAGLIMLTKLQAMEWAIYESRRKGVPMGRVGAGEDTPGRRFFWRARTRAIRPAAC